MHRATPPKRDDYPACYEIPTRWLDNDIYGHINNVAYAEYINELGALARQQGQNLMIHNNNWEFQRVFGDQTA